MKKKVLSALLSVAMVATLLVGCGAKAEAPAAEAPAGQAEVLRTGLKIKPQSYLRFT